MAASTSELEADLERRLQVASVKVQRLHAHAHEAKQQLRAVKERLEECLNALCYPKQPFTLAQQLDEERSRIARLLGELD